MSKNMVMDETQVPYIGQTEKLTNWKNEPTILTLKADLLSSRSSQTAQLAKITKWDNLLNVKGDARPRVSKNNTRSAIQPKLIRRQNEWRYSALSEPFLGSEKLFKVSPVSFEDENGAKQNELMLNYQFNNKINKIKFIDDYVHTVVDEGTVIVRLGWKRSTVPVKQIVPVWDYYQVEDEEGLAILQQGIELSTSNPREFNENAPEELKAAVAYYQETGTPVLASQVDMTEITVDKILENRPTVEIMNTTNVFIDPSCQGDLDKALFVIVSFETNKAELLKDGDRYSNLDMVNWESSTPSGEPDHATSTPDDFAFGDSMRRKIVAYEYWGFFDIHSNGSLVPFVATWIGDVLIRMEENPFPDEKLPFVVATYLPVKRQLYGEPDAELLEENQKIIGAVTRGAIDMLGKSANGQQGFAKNMLDPLNRRRFELGDTYEFNPSTHPSQGYIEHKYPELPGSVMQILQLMNQDAEGLTGVKSFSGGLAGNAYGNVATGIRGMLDAASKREMAIIRRLAKGICDIGTKMAAMNAAFLSEEEVVRVTNKEYVTIMREDLKGNYDFQVDISTTEVDDMKAQDLGFMLQTVGPNMDLQIFMYLLAEIAELKRMPTLANTLRTYKPAPDPVAEEMKQLELEKLRLENLKLQSEVEKNMADAAKKKSEADMKDLDFAQSLDGTKHNRDMEKQKGQAQGNQELEITKALLKPKKLDEIPGDIEAGIGYNELSKIKAKSPQGRAQLTQDNPEYNINSSQYDSSLDPALNPNINI